MPTSVAFIFICLDVSKAQRLPEIYSCVEELRSHWELWHSRNQRTGFYSPKVWQPADRLVHLSHGIVTVSFKMQVEVQEA
jgi:hypothetical protein